MDQPENILIVAKSLLDNAYGHTSLLDVEDAKETFQAVSENLTYIILNKQGRKKVWDKFCSLSVAVFSSTSLNDMIKVVWRVARDQDGDALYKLAYFLTGVTAILVTAKTRHSVSVVDEWQETCEKWLGNQLTIGGKGVTGAGEGTAQNRIQRFFTTPYLHDFD